MRGVLAICSLCALQAADSGRTQIPLADEFREAERLYWLDNWVKARPLYADCEQRFAVSDPATALICKFSRLRADAETNLSYYTVSKIIAQDLQTETSRSHPEVRLRGLMVKAEADLSIHDPVLSGKEWEQAQQLARSLKEGDWEERIEAEEAIIAYLEGDTAKAVTLNTASFEKAKALNDVAGMVRALSLKGVGLLERNAADQALPYFDQALQLAKANPDVRFPLMAYMGKAQALESQGDLSAASRLLGEANAFVEQIGMTVYKADLAIALGNQAEKRSKFGEAEADFDRACAAAKLSHMPRPFADAMFHKIELRERNNDWRGAEKLIPAALAADRELIDIQFLPQHLADAAGVEVRIGNVARGREYLSQANDLIEAALAKAPSPSIERSLIATMNGVFIEQFELALEHDRNVAKAFEIMEDVRSRVIAEHLRSADSESPVRNTRTKALNAQIADIQLRLISSARTAPDRSKLLQSLDEAEAELDAGKFSHDQRSRPVHAVPVTLSAIQAALSADELIVEYVVGDEESFALAVTRDSVRAYKLPRLKDLGSLVHDYTEEAATAVPEQLRINSHRLYAAALGQIAELGRKPRLIVVPDGPLDSVGFDSLVDDRGRYLVRSHVISYVPSATVLELLRNRPRNLNAPYSVLAFGAPELPNQLPSSRAPKFALTRQLLDISGGNLAQLRSASGEVRVISCELGGPSRVFVGHEATEARFKSEPLTQFRVIHFATHAFADVHHPERSAIVLAPDPASGDDGLLQIREIQELNLRTDLVTLSACDAGDGRPEGMQGLESLVSAFQFAGARSVLASRWVTDDTFAASLMTDVYRELAAGLRVADALRDAKLTALNKFGNAARPALWSAFFVSGEPNTTVHGK